MRTATPAAVASTMTSVPSATAVATCCAATPAPAHSTWHAAVRPLRVCSIGLPASVVRTLWCHVFLASHMAVIVQPHSACKGLSPQVSRMCPAAAGSARAAARPAHSPRCSSSSRLRTGRRHSPATRCRCNSSNSGEGNTHQQRNTKAGVAMGAEQYDRRLQLRTCVAHVLPTPAEQPAGAGASWVAESG
jgi:hypothetical protein